VEATTSPLAAVRNNGRSEALWEGVGASGASPATDPSAGLDVVTFGTFGEVVAGESIMANGVKELSA
jgi:hypothetical protein